MQRLRFYSHFRQHFPILNKSGMHQTGHQNAPGPAGPALGRLRALTLPAEAKGQIEGQIEELSAVMAAIKADAPDLKLTIDPVENRGFEYHTGVTFTFFAKGVRGELGNGGRYQANGGAGSDSEPATGFTLFMDTVLRAVPAPELRSRVFLPIQTTAEDAAGLRAEGWITVAGLEECGDGEAEAARVGFSHVLDGGKVRKINKSNKE